MRNRYPGTCYRCGVLVEAGAGHFERIFGHWRVQHAECAIEHRGKPDRLRTLATRQARLNRARADAVAEVGRE